MRYYVPSRHADLLSSMIRPATRDEAKANPMSFQFRGMEGQYVLKNKENPRLQNVLGMFQQLGYGENYGDMPRVQESILRVHRGEKAEIVAEDLLQSLKS